MTGGGKTFEVIYLLWMYLLTQKVPALDFIGMTPAGPRYVYFLLALVMVAVAALARQRELLAS